MRFAILFVLSLFIASSAGAASTFKRIYPGAWYSLGPTPCGLRTSDLPFVGSQRGRSWHWVVYRNGIWDNPSKVRASEVSWVRYDGHMSTQVRFPRNC